MLTAITITRLEKAAGDNGFDLDLRSDNDWLLFGSSQTSLRIWLTAVGESRFLVAVSRTDVLDALAGFGVTFTDPLPGGAVGARSVTDIPALHRLMRRAFQLSRTLPDELLHIFESEIASLPRSTEAERLIVQRVGQDIFRRGLLEYWEGRCAITGLAVPDLLRASHIKPWADCEGDAERLDVFNGLLLGPHLDAAFDAGFITIVEDGTVLLSDTLPTDAQAILGLQQPLKVRGMHRAHERYLLWHRTKVFRTGASSGRGTSP
jgi:putative restriction endonuclease